MKVVVSGVEFLDVRTLAAALISQSLVAVGAGVVHERHSWDWLAELYAAGDRMTVRDVQDRIQNICDEAWAGFQLAGVTRDDLRRVCGEKMAISAVRVEREVGSAAALIQASSRRGGLEFAVDVGALLESV